MSAFAIADEDVPTLPAFVPVTGITGVPTTATAGTPLTLSGTVVPNNATNQAITWSVQNAGTTGSTIMGDILNTTAAGTATVRATIMNGTAVGTNYTQDFFVTVATGGGNPGNGSPSRGGGGCSVGFGVLTLTAAVCVLLRRHPKRG